MMTFGLLCYHSLQSKSNSIQQKTRWLRLRSATTKEKQPKARQHPETPSKKHGG